MNDLRWESRPKLRAPMMIAAFEGWTDAGGAASGAASYLSGRWKARKFADIDAEDFYDFTALRPQVRLRGDQSREIVWPVNRFLAASIPGPHDLIIMTGVEPHMRWRTFSECVTTVATELQVEAVFTLGAMLADVAHSRPVPVRTSTADARLAERMGLRRPQYQGPTGIVGVLQDAFAQVSIPVGSLMAQVPHYIPGMPSPKATLAVVRRVCDLLATQVPTSDLEKAARPTNARSMRWWQERTRSPGTSASSSGAPIRPTTSLSSTTCRPETPSPPSSSSSCATRAIPRRPALVNSAAELPHTGTLVGFPAGRADRISRAVLMIDVELLYRQHLTDADQRLLNRTTGGRATLREALSDPRMEAAVFSDAPPDGGFVDSSPFLTFAVAVHRTAARLDHATYVEEAWTARQRIPVFDVIRLRDLLADPARCFFLVELLASYTHVSSGVTWERTRRGWRRRRFSELDPVGLAGLLDVVEPAERPGVYRRLGDLSLFLTGSSLTTPSPWSSAE